MSEALRVFLSIDIDDDSLLDRIQYLQQKLDRNAAKMKMVERENIHFTWRFFGDTKPERIRQIKDELDSLEITPFTVRVAGIGAFPNFRRPRVIWVGVDDGVEKMRGLKKATDDLLGNLGYKIERRKFIPHATIARVRSVREREQLVENLHSLKDEDVGFMTVKSIRMTKSTLTSSGPIYETLWEIV